jgi:ParB family chromosome partitioning protein
MKLDFIPLDKLSVSKTNMRHGRHAPDVADILPTIRARGILQSLIVRPEGAPGHYEIVAGRRRFHAACLLAEEAGQAEPLPCAILDAGDDAAALEASLIENVARLDPDEVSQWETFARLIRQGRTAESIAATFGLPDLAVRRVLALGNLLPRIRSLYAKGDIDPATVRHLTLASKTQQRDWLALRDDPDGYAPTGSSLKAWLFGGHSLPTRFALFDVDASGLAAVADLFGEDSYFADADAFWTAQNAAIEARRAAYLDAGWTEVVVIPPTAHFSTWEYEKTAKRKSGRVYIDVRASGEVVFHEGYLSRKEAARAARSAGGESEAGAVKPARPEITSALQTYVDLHRHAAVRAALLDHPQAALRLLVAHLIVGSHLVSVRPDPHTARDDATKESVENSPAEARFDAARRPLLALLGIGEDEPTLIGGARDQGLAEIFLRLLGLSDAELLAILAVVMGESLAVGSVAVEAAGAHIGLAMQDYWQADDAFFAPMRDRQVLAAIVGEVAGETVAQANAGEKGAAMKRIIADHLDGRDGRPKVENWVPRWMAFPPSAYTTRGGVGPVAAAKRLADARDALACAADPAAGGEAGTATDGEAETQVALAPDGPGSDEAGPAEQPLAA